MLPPLQTARFSPSALTTGTGTTQKASLPEAKDVFFSGRADKRLLMTRQETFEVGKMLHRRPASDEATILAELKQFVTSHHLDINAKAVGGYSLFAAIVDTLLPSVVEYALAEGGDVHAPIFRRTTGGGALFRVATNFTPTYSKTHTAENLPKVIRNLLEYGANINEQDGRGWTPLLRALEQSDAEDSALAARRLIEEGADINIAAYPLKVFGYDEYPHGMTPRMVAQYRFNRAPNPTLGNVLQTLKDRQATFTTEDPQVLEDMMAKHRQAQMRSILQESVQIRLDRPES